MSSPSGRQHHRSCAVSCFRSSPAARPDRSGPDRAGLVLGRYAHGGLPGRPAPCGHHQGSGLDPARARRGCGRGLPGGRRPRHRIHDLGDFGGGWPG